MSNINFDQASVGKVSSGAEALSVTNTGSGTGVLGTRSESHGFLAGKDPVFQQHAGVYGQSDQQGVMGLTTVPKGTGVYGGGAPGAIGDQIGVRGETNTSSGVLGRSFGAGTGVSGTSDGGHGVHAQNGAGSGFSPNVGTGVNAESDNGFGVYGTSRTNVGVFGESQTTNGVFGVTHSSSVAAVSGANKNGGIGVFGEGGTGVLGRSFGAGTGVSGTSAGGHGVHAQNGAGSGFSPNVGTGVNAESDNGFGVYGTSRTNVGVFGESQTTNGVFGVTHSSSVAAVSGVNKNGGIGIFGEGRIAGSFFGDVEISGDLTILNGRDIRLADFAEDFDVSSLEEIEPGSVVVLDDEGSVQQSRAAYDHKVAGVVSGAGNFRSAITLDRHKSPGTRKAIALMGKVYCKVDAQYSAIGVGDLLTTSSTPGHAMKAVDPLKSFGSVIGKALKGLDRGRALIPILIALQ